MTRSRCRRIENPLLPSQFMMPASSARSLPTLLTANRFSKKKEQVSWTKEQLFWMRSMPVCRSWECPPLPKNLCHCARLTIFRRMIASCLIPRAGLSSPLFGIYCCCQNTSSLSQRTESKRSTKLLSFTHGPVIGNPRHRRNRAFPEPSCNVSTSVRGDWIARGNRRAWRNLHTNLRRSFGVSS